MLKNSEKNSNTEHELQLSFLFRYDFEKKKWN